MDKVFYIQCTLTGISDTTQGEVHQFTYGKKGELVAFKNLGEKVCHITQFDFTAIRHWAGEYGYTSQSRAEAVVRRNSQNNRPDPNWKEEVKIIEVAIR